MILLWDSSDKTVRLRLVDSEYQEEFAWPVDRQLAKDMLAYLRDRLAQRDKTLKDLTGIGVFRGPGSFTGLRIGLTVLNTVADAQNIPIVGTTGAQWQAEALSRLQDGENDKIVMAEYGSPAHVTQPRK
ncbi:MAG: hypothetical protein KDA17_01725 [Candidatus Saccharibacteria bacterium]|nr:hypothetical protein [Candidatus Saccharibacteria bacterium]MCA9336975.1 hypothetical protein [Candidatus Saccharibacteria bacterium]MCA9339607.1 hypothetical protein [Candidatus Saccharibacteria bacterium]